MQKKADSLILAKQKGDIIIEPENFAGPTALVRESSENKIIDEAKKIIIRFSPKAVEIPKFNEKN